MKKAVLIVGTVVIAAIAAQAQNRADVNIVAPSMCAVFTQNTPKRNKVVRGDTTQLGRAVDRQVAKQVKKQTPKAQSSKTAVRPQQNDTVQQQEKKAGRKEWMRAIFLGGSYPWETPELYQKRMEAQSYPASLPFK